MELSDRQKTILATVIEEYIETAEPVGSKAVLERSGLGCSSATVRNELMELENLGYLTHPHTSAGRIPTSLGYRKYVNELMERKNLPGDEAESIRRGLTPENAGRVTAELTKLPALTLTTPRKARAKRFDLIYLDPNSFIIVILLEDNAVKNKLIRLPFSFDEALIRRLNAVFNASFTGITEEEITPILIDSCERGTGDSLGLTSVIAGFTAETLRSQNAPQGSFSGGESLLKIPEFQDSDKAHRVMSYLSEAGIKELDVDSVSDVRVVIGAENAAEELRDTSVILASYDAGDGMRGVIGVVGPTRMDYSLVAAKLRVIADGLSKILSGGALPPAGFGKLMLLEGDRDGKR